MTRVPFYTYSLGRSLYVPLTCRSNSKTLPETRGPNFCLPPEVVSALCRFRDLELEEQRWSHWCNWLDTQEYDQALPDPVDKVVELQRPPQQQEQQLGDNNNSCVSNSSSSNGVVEAALRAEITAQLERNTWENLKFGGEGEPTLNLELLESLATEFSSQVPVTVMTNGLVAAGGGVDGCPSSLKAWGVSAVSVAFLTHDARQYDEMMEPVIRGSGGGHDQMCSFVRNSVLCDLRVELTGIDRPGVNKGKAQELARALGVETEIRWRPYFP